MLIHISQLPNNSPFQFELYQFELFCGFTFPDSI